MAHLSTSRTQSNFTRLSRGSRRSSGPWVAAIVCAAATLGFAASASALPLITFSADLRGLYGSALGGEEVVDYYGPGIGLRAGVSLPLGWYVGASADHYFGVKADEVTAGTPVPEFTASQTQFLGHLGFDWGIGPLSLRPTLGAGYAMSDIELESASAGFTSPGSEGDFMLSPGAEFVVSLGLLTVGAEARYNYVFRGSVADALGKDADAGALIFGFGFGLSL